ALLLFYVGCAFAWFLVLPAVFGFLTAVTPEGVAMMTDITRYLDFVLVILLAFGLGCELPVAVVVLVLLGVVTPAQLREARGYVIVGIFVLAAIVTPPDLISQLLLAIPMCLLYEAGIVTGALLRRRRSGEHTSELQSRENLVCRHLLEKKKSSQPDGTAVSPEP